MALDCRIIRDDNGNLKKVEAPNGEKSILFDKLKNFFGEKKALELYALTETEAFKNLMSYKRGVFLNEQKEKLNDIRFSIVGEKGASKVEKYNSLLNSAKELEGKGISADEIEKQTGWYKRDGQWKYLAPEILEQLQIKDNYEVNKIYKLQDVLQDKTTLLQMYPEMGNIQVVFYDNSSENSIPETKNWGKSEAAYNSEKNILGINSGRLRERGDIGLVQRKFAHELTHAIAREEGFPLGGGYFTVFSKVLNLLNLPNGSNVKTVRDKLNSVNRTQFSKEDNDILDEGLRAVFAVYDNNYMTLNDQYRRLMGEVDARLVEEVLQKIQNGEDVTLPYNQYLQIFAGESGIDLNTTLIIRGNDVQLSFSQENKTAGEISQELIDRLKQNGLSEDVFLMSTEEIDAKLKELGVSDDVRKQVIAYHGSPYSFDRFTTNAIGTGEGAQVFGWGLYFTSLEDIARRYAKELEPQFLNLEVVDKTLSDAQKLEALSNFDVTFTPENSEFYYRIYLSPENGIGIEQVENNGRVSQIRYVEEFEELYNEINDYFEETFDFNLLDIEGKYTDGFYKNGLPVQKTTKLNDKGNQNILYKVYLHKGKNPSEYTYLDNDKIVGKDTIDKVKKRLNIEGFDSISDRIENNITGEDLYEILTRVGKGKENPYKEASLFLLRAGIDGIKYPAESISRGATSDTARGFNYVVFDENAITIEEQIQFQKALNKVGIDMIVNGFVYKNQVFLNKDVASNETAIHEFSHLFNSWLKENRKELYNKGIDLVKNEVNNTTKTAFSKQVIDNENKGFIQDFSVATIKGKEYQFLKADNVFYVEVDGIGEIAKATLNKEGYLDNIRVNENYRRMGVGSALYDYIEEINGIKLKPSPIKISKEAQSLWEKRNEKSEIQDIISYVKTTQPDLKGEAFYEEILTEVVSRYSGQLMDEQKIKSPLMQWLSDFWKTIADLFNIFELSPSQVANLTLKEFSEYSVSALINNDIVLEKLIQLNIIERLC